MPLVTISDQERKLLDLIAKGEAVRGRDPYLSLWPSTVEPGIIQLTLDEVQQFQQQRIDAGYASSACGRYQFIKQTLKECIGYLGVDPKTTRFTPVIQDRLIIARLKAVRKMNEWLADDPNWPTHKFMIKLAQEFASMPVPYEIQGQNRVVAKGESYYAGDRLNKSNHDPDAVHRELEDIKNNEPGPPFVRDDDPAALPPTGVQSRTRVATEASGGGVGAYTGGNAGERPVPRTTLPATGAAVYGYRVIDPLDDRYDFRTGEKVKDILVHGTGAQAGTPVINRNIGPANVSTTNSGVVEAGEPGPQTEAAREPCPEPINSGPGGNGGV